MTKHEILSKVDHTILKPEATWRDVQAICDDALWGKAASVCIPPVFVSKAADYLMGAIPVCTVLGFPHGNTTTKTKVLEAEDAVQNGANEVDMVIHIGMAKEGRWAEILKEIQLVKEACREQILKVIIEACLLTKEEKLSLCHVISASGAEYIKTSTGFSAGGAELEDVALFRAQVAPHVKIKAAGGIRTFEAAEAFLQSGADRIGSSALIPLAKQGEM